MIVLFRAGLYIYIYIQEKQEKNDYVIFKYYYMDIRIKQK